MPAGFYYRMMHKPAPIWPIALKQVRKAAGLGVISPDFQMTGKYDELYPKADVCVIGGGPAGYVCGPGCSRARVAGDLAGIPTLAGRIF